LALCRQEAGCYLSELSQCGLQVLDYLRGYHMRGRQVFGVLQRLVPEPENVEAGLVSGDQFLVGEGSEPLGLCAFEPVLGVVAGDEIVQVGAFGVLDPLLRYECRLRRGRLTSRWAATRGGNVGIVGDLTETKLESLASATFVEQGFDRAVVGPVDFLGRIEALPISPARRLALIGIMFRRAFGQDSGLSDNAARQYRELERQLGIAIDLPGRDFQPFRLDWGRGCQVPAA
jgi:hypothetical protein